MWNSCWDGIVVDWKRELKGNMEVLIDFRIGMDLLDETHLACI
jgi:hypothetical protein